MPVAGAFASVCVNPEGQGPSVGKVMPSQGLLCDRGRPASYVPGCPS